MEIPVNIVCFFSSTAIKRSLFLFSCFFIINTCFGKPITRAEKGVLSLRNINWTNNGIVDLNGEWAFYWNALYTPASFDSAVLTPGTYANVPDFWNKLVPDQGLLTPAFGYATYRLQVLCPPQYKKLQLKFLTVASAYKLFVNGEQIAEIGKVGTSKLTTTAAFQPAIFDVTPVNNQLDIVVQVANYTYNVGGLWDFIKLGTADEIAIYQSKNIARDFFIAGSFFIIGLFYLVIYFFFRRRVSPIYFACFCILIGIRSLLTGELGIRYITPWSWQLIKHMEYLTVYLAVPVAALFSYQLFPNEFSKKVLRLILIVSIPFVATVLFASPLLLRYTLRPFQVFMVLTVAYGLYVYICAVKNRRTGSAYFLAGFVILFITVINDILYTSLVIQSTNLLYAGLYMLVLCQATALSRQFFRAYTKIEKLNKQLEQANEELNVKNNTINETNEQLSKLNAELDNLVFRTSHDLRSPITSLFTMVDIIKGEKDANARNEFLNFQKRTLLRLNSMITEILDYAKNKSTALQCEPIDWEAFIQNALQDHVFSDNSARIKKIVAVSQPCVFETDKMRLSMIMNNLISNGLKHHNTEQENPYLQIVVQVTDKQAAMVIEDNGQGIEQQHLNHIFTKFYRASSKLTGSGFGLYIVKETVERLGGTISVESQVNTGTKFSIVIPNYACR